jgi:hypothetical protein
VRKVGRAVVPVAPSPGETVYVTTPAVSPVNVAGFDLTVVGPPFMEQDERVSRCATAALWMSTSAMADRVGMAAYSTAEITQFATRYFVSERSLPSGGLYPEQMAESLRAMGYEAVKAGTGNVDQAASIIYSYVESGVPPILFLKLPGTGHVVTAVGHSWVPAPVHQPPPREVAWITDPALTFHRSVSWVPSFLAHDDEHGPFVRVYLQSSADQLISAYGPETAEALLASGGVPVTVEKQLRYDPLNSIRYQALLVAILIPHPPNVSLVSAEAERKAARLLKIWFLIQGQAPPTDFVLRTYLARSNDLKRWVHNSKMHPYARDLHLGKGMPRWVWVTEISEVPSMNAPDPEQSLIRGEVVIDATSNPWTADFLVFHLIHDSDGYFATMLPSDRDPEAVLSKVWRLPGEQPYPYLGRHLGGV